jgi:hypothetical protein
MVAPQDAPETCIQQARPYGVEVMLVPGLISDAGCVAADVAQQRGWFLESGQEIVLFFTESGLPGIAKYSL